MAGLAIEGCFNGPTGCDVEQSKLAFNSPEGRYKTTIMQNLQAYIRMKDFVKTYQDTIIAYNRKQNANTQGFILNASFLDTGTTHTITSPHLPPYLLNKFIPIHLGLSSLPYYWIDITGDLIDISVSDPERYNKDGIVVRHILTWHTRKWTGKAGIFQRDTLLPGAATYSIFTDCNLGR
jgi:hypothetical protein